MAKKRRTARTVAAAKEGAGAREDEEGQAASGISTDPIATPLGEAELDLVLRAVRWLSSQPRTAVDELHAALLDAARPLVAQRAAKYEEDAKAHRLAEVAAGNVGRTACQGPPGRGQAKRPLGADDSCVEGDILRIAGKELMQASQALRALAGQPELLASKACKPLRAALHPLVSGHLQEERASPAFRVTCMLGQRSRWAEARLLLSQLRGQEAGRRLKLGAYQRWVRELNVAEGTGEELAMLDAVMRLAAGLPAGLAAPPAKGTLVTFPPWCAVANAAADNNRGEACKAAAKSQTKAEPAVSEQPTSTASKLFGLIAERRQAAAERAGGRPAWTVLAHEAAHERNPPNHYDLNIYECSPEALPLTNPVAGGVKSHPVPGVSGGFVLPHVLSASECDSLREISESIGYRPDVPLSSPLDERAQNVVLMASEEQHNALFSRVREALPQELSGEQLVGLNRRWRLYRYSEGNLYRKHLDGAWPAGGIREDASGRPEYVYDTRSGCRSRLTFIVYLNDDFEGGTTTFFVPDPAQEGQLECRPVQPMIGCATVFPHGDTGVPLLHEGSSVSRGQKYLLRTDVLFSSSSSQEALHAARLRGLARQLGGLGGKDLTEAQGDSEETPKRKAGQTRKVVKKGLKGGKEAQEGKRLEKRKPGSKRGSKRSRGPKGEAAECKRARGKTGAGEAEGQAGKQAGARTGPKRPTRRMDSKLAAKLKVVGRLKVGKNAV